MILTLQQLGSLATNYVMGRLDYTASDASLAINLAYSEVGWVEKHPSREQSTAFSTTSGTPVYLVATDYEYGLAISTLSTQNGPNDNGRELRHTEYREMDSRSTILGEPEAWADYGNQIYLWPSPDSSYSYKVEYIRKLPVLVNSTDTPLVDDRYHLAIAMKAAEHLAAWRNDADSEAVAHARYLSYMGSLPNMKSDRMQAQGGRGVRLIRQRSTY